MLYGACAFGVGFLSRKVSFVDSNFGNTPVSEARCSVLAERVHLLKPGRS